MILTNLITLFDPFPRNKFVQLPFRGRAIGGAKKPSYALHGKHIGELFKYIFHKHQCNTNDSNKIEGKRNIILCKELCKNIFQIMTHVQVYNPNKRLPRCNNTILTLWNWL